MRLQTVVELVADVAVVERIVLRAFCGAERVVIAEVGVAVGFVAAAVFVRRAVERGLVAAIFPRLLFLFAAVAARTRLWS